MATLISADDEWSPLKAVIVGRAAQSCFPHAPRHMIEATMPEQHWDKFVPKHNFPAEVLSEADKELDNFAAVLEKHGVTVYRPKVVDWHAAGGYTGAMPRDTLTTVGNKVIESFFAWECRRNEVDLAYSDILEKLKSDSTEVVRAPKPPKPDPLYDDGIQTWAINESRPAFECADFMRFGKTIVGQLSHVTNMAGVEWFRSQLPPGYEVEILATDDSHAMHIDATILPLRKGLLAFNASRVSESALRRHKVFQDWDLQPIPFEPAPVTATPLFMTSTWLMMNVLVLDGNKVVIEEKDKRFGQWLSDLGMTPIPCPFQHVWSIGGSFHCATVDLVRQP